MWQRRKILVLGMTYPNYSRKYVENVCTGGLFADTLEMCRIHPVPKRYWDEADQFKSWQWIEADVEQHDGDPRPESWRLGDSVDIGEVIPAGKKGWEERRRFLDDSPYLFDEWRALQDAHAEKGLSLAIVQPAEIVNLRIQRKSPKEEAEWQEKERELLAQEDMFRKLKPLDPK